jgi:hypothetical protein
VFDSETFVADCQRAASETDPVSAVADAVVATIRDGAAIDAVLGTELRGEADTLYSSAELTVQRIMWPGGVASPPHDHRMWAVVGVYAGEEVNRLYERGLSGLEERAVRPVGAAGVLTFGEKTIHSALDRVGRARLRPPSPERLDTCGARVQVFDQDIPVHPVLPRLRLRDALEAQHHPAQAWCRVKHGVLAVLPNGPHLHVEEPAPKFRDTLRASRVDIDVGVHVSLHQAIAGSVT